MDPLQIALITDTHASSLGTTPYSLSRVVAKTNALNADLILHGGDFIARSRPGWRAASTHEAVEPFAALRAPLGVFAVLGNHDWRDDPAVKNGTAKRPRVEDMLADTGITVLSNEGCLIQHGQGGHGGQGGQGQFYLCGTDSYQGRGRIGKPDRHDDLDAALAEAPPTTPHTTPRLLLAHEPDMIRQAAGRVDLQMSGHCHRGQFDLFGWRPISPSLLASRHTYGLSHFGQTPLVVSAGIGCSGLPLRIAAPPEITVIEIA